jgi:hypothetical protein
MTATTGDTPRTLNAKIVGKTLPGAVYVGRPTKWGNPFILGRDGDRATVIARYRTWLLAQPQLVADARRDLAGKHLICWCAPAACHADVLREIANGAD